MWPADLHFAVQYYISWYINSLKYRPNPDPDPNPNPVTEPNVRAKFHPRQSFSFCGTRVEAEQQQQQQQQQQHDDDEEEEFANWTFSTF